MHTRLAGTVLGSQIEVATLQEAADTLFSLAVLRRPAYVCFATAYMLVKASHNAVIHRAYASAAMVTPDGAPVAWCLRLIGYRGGDCISGPRLTPLLLANAAERGITVGFYGGRVGTLELMQQALKRRWPDLKIGYVCSPPFRVLEAHEQEPMLMEIRASGVQLLFIGLGSPKQDLWMYDHSPSLDCTCLGVGAAFEFLSGEKTLPPLWMQRMGLTWLVRLCQEPRRLAIRNLYSPIFVAMFAVQRLFGVRFERHVGSEEMRETPAK